MRLVRVFSCLPPAFRMPVEMMLRRKNRLFVRLFRMDVKDARFLVIDPDDGVCRHDLMILHPGQHVAHLFQHDRIEIRAAVIRPTTLAYCHPPPSSWKICTTVSDSSVRTCANTSSAKNRSRSASRALSWVSTPPRYRT